ncbi:hypothetical protein C8J57DRAFT_1514634 [Mycena rebaudengoi]|nr:hypothetical protein C8J57DRAFT_1514634 [Mycena rebaudengoi]
MAAPPQELIDFILELVDDRSALRSCALVATSFVTVSQRRLFRSLQLHATEEESTQAHSSLEKQSAQAHRSLEEIDLFLLTHPLIASFIHELTTPIPFRHEQFALASILGLLPNITCLIIHVHYSNIEPSLMTALHGIMPSLRLLELRSLNIPSSFLLYAAFCVPILSIYRIRVASSPSSDITSPAPGSQVRLRHVKLTTHFLEHPDYSVLLDHPELTSHIERLHLRVFSSDALPSGYYERLLRAVAPTLRHLRWEYCIPPTVAIPPMRHVHTLELDVLIGLHGLYADFPAVLVRFAEAMPHITLLVLHGFTGAMAEEASLQRAAGVAYFPELRRVECRLIPHKDMGDRDLLVRYAHEAIEELIPALAGRAMLCCGFVDTPDYIPVM